MDVLILQKWVVTEQRTISLTFSHYETPLEESYNSADIKRIFLSHRHRRDAQTEKEWSWQGGRLVFRRLESSHKLESKEELERQRQETRTNEGSALIQNPVIHEQNLQYSKSSRTNLGNSGAGKLLIWEVWNVGSTHSSNHFRLLKSMTLFLPYWTFTHRFSSSTNPTNGKQLSFWR